MSKTGMPDHGPPTERPAPNLNGAVSACATCSARCCHEYTVTVTGYDVWTIATGLRLAPQQFLIHYAARPDAAGSFRLDQGDARFDIALDKIADERPHRPCVFLVELPGGGGRCGIHAHRPHVCQTYPAYLDHGVVALRDDVMCPSGAWKLSRMDVAAWREQMQDFVVQRDIYEQVVQCWNARVEAAEAGSRFSIAAYYDFLLNVYARLAAVQLALPPERWRAVVAGWNRARLEHGNPLERGNVTIGKGGQSLPQVAYLGEVAAIIAAFHPAPPAGTSAQDWPPVAVAAG